MLLLLVETPDLAFSLGVITELPEDFEGLFRRAAPDIGVLQGSRVLLPDQPCVIPAHLLLDNSCDVLAPSTRTGDGVDEGERLSGEGDVGANEAHRVAPYVDRCHTA